MSLNVTRTTADATTDGSQDGTDVDDYPANEKQINFKYVQKLFQICRTDFGATRGFGFFLTNKTVHGISGAYIAAVEKSIKNKNKKH